MAYSADWIGKIITIPQSDLTFISGVNYSLDIADVHVEVNRIQSATDEGLWAAQVIEFYPTVTLSGINKPPTVEFINGYTVEFGGSNYNVILSGYDTNLIDVLTPGNGISVLGNNSIGKIVIGSGLSTQQDADLTLLKKRCVNKKSLIKETGVWYFVVYDDDESTPIVKKALKDVDGLDVDDIVAGALGQEMMNSA